MMSLSFMTTFLPTSTNATWQSVTELLTSGPKIDHLKLSKDGAPETLKYSQKFVALRSHFKKSIWQNSWEMIIFLNLTTIKNGKTAEVLD